MEDNLRPIDERIKVLRQVVEREAMDKGLRHPKVIQLSQILDRYVSQVMQEQLEHYRVKTTSKTMRKA